MKLFKILEKYGDVPIRVWVYMPRKEEVEPQNVNKMAPIWEGRVKELMAEHGKHIDLVVGERVEGYYALRFPSRTQGQLKKYIDKNKYTQNVLKSKEHKPSVAIIEDESENEIA